MRILGRILIVFVFALITVSSSLMVNQASALGSGSGQLVAVSQSDFRAPNGAFFDHVVIILMENQGIFDVCRDSPPPCLTSGPAPFMAGLANSFGIGSQYLSLINTSQPNYVALIGGSTLGCTSSGCPTITAPNLVDRFESVGLTWKGYFENQNVATGCDTTSHEPYTPIHNPFVAFQDVTNNTVRCNQLVLANPSGCGSVTDCVLINDLNSRSAPNFMWLTPNDCNDMRGASGICSASISSGDNYLASLVPSILNSETFKYGHSALFITFDEGNGFCPLNGSSENCVYSVWAGPAAKTSFGTTNLYNHFAFPKTIEANWNLASLSTGDGSATSMAEFFNSASPSPDFTISASPNSLSFPAGLNLTLNPSTVSPSYRGTGTSTLSVGSSNPGNYTVTITGTSGSLSHQTTVTVNICTAKTGDFSITASPSSMTLSTGSSARSTISLQSLNGFTGTRTLSATVSPTSDLSFYFSSSSVTLTSGGQGTSTLNVRASYRTPIGTYTITVTGTSGSISHSVTVTVNVTA